MSNFQYQVGGSLIDNAPSYVARQCDTALYTALNRGEFCYVLNSRQMGKSSLLVQTRHRLELEGYACAVIDMTNIGSENITPLQWYKGIVTDLWRSFKPLRKFDLRTWWQNEGDISLLQRFSRFIGDVLLPGLPDANIVIFLDEIDSILSLPFSVDDFFALIRHCYNQRAISPDYRRIHFAIFGVANPSDLIRDRKRTPFNLGTAISLDGFTLQEAQPLAHGITVRAGDAQAVLREILQWTNGQPFLTQKLCQLAISCSRETTSGKVTIPPGHEAAWVEQLVRTHILKDWESQDEPEHLRTIRNRILSYSEATGRLLSYYGQVLQANEMSTEESWEQVELQLSGLAVQDGNCLRVKNRIYAEVFNLDWVTQQLGQLRPYAYALDAWAVSGRRDESRLLRGQALLDAQQWSQGKRLSDLDYQFLSASAQSDRRQVQQSLEADRVKAVEAQLFQEQRNVKLQRWFLITHSIGLLSSLGLAITIFWLYRQSQGSEQQAKLSQVRALVSSAEGSFDSNRQLESLVQSIQARTEFQSLKQPEKKLGDRAVTALQTSLYGTDEANRITADVGMNQVAASPDGQWIVAACADGTLRLWRADGTLVRRIQAHQAGAVAVEFSPDSQKLLSASADTTVKVWRIDGTLLHTLKGDRSEIVAAKFSPNGQQIAAIDENGAVKVWGSNGQLQRTLGPATTLAFSPQGELAIAGRGPIRIWRRNGTLLGVFPAPTTSEALAFSPDGKTLAQAVAARNRDGIYLWQMDGTLQEVFHGPETVGIHDLAFSSDGRFIATAGNDKAVRLWEVGSGLFHNFQGHQATVWSVAFSPDSKTLLSASDDRTVRLWKLKNPAVEGLGGNPGPIMEVAVNPISHQIVSVSVDQRITLFQPDRTGQFGSLHPKTLLAHQAPIRGIAFSPDGLHFATASRDRTAILWTANGDPVQTLYNQAQVEGVAFSPNGNTLAIASEDNTVKLWHRSNTATTFDPRSIQIWRGHQASVKRVAFSPDSRYLASASADKTLKLWDAVQGTVLKTLTGHQAEVRAVAFSPRGDLIASASADNTIKLWQRDGTLLKTFWGHRGAVWAVAFSPDGKWIASSSMDSTLKIWRLNGTLAYTLKRHKSAVRSLAFAPDGQWLVSGSDDQVLLRWHFNRIVQFDELAYACRWVGHVLRTNSDFRADQASICRNKHSQ